MFTYFIYSSVLQLDVLITNNGRLLRLEILTTLSRFSGLNQVELVLCTRGRRNFLRRQGKRPCMYSVRSRTRGSESPEPSSNACPPYITTPDGDYLRRRPVPFSFSTSVDHLCPEGGELYRFRNVSSS